MAARKKATVNDRTELIEALDAIEKEKQISKDIILEAVENSLHAKTSMGNRRMSG